jgi:hypothetical protein
LRVIVRVVRESLMQFVGGPSQKMRSKTLMRLFVLLVIVTALVAVVVERISLKLQREQPSM